MTVRELAERRRRCSAWRRSRRPCPRPAGARAGRGGRACRRGCGPGRGRRGRTSSARARPGARASASSDVHSLSATNASSRRPSRPCASTRAASPYIGEVSRKVDAGVERGVHDVVAVAADVERLPRAHADDGHARPARAELTRLHRPRRLRGSRRARYLLVALAHGVAHPVHVWVWSFGHVGRLPRDRGAESGGSLVQLGRGRRGERDPQRLALRLAGVEVQAGDERDAALDRAAEDRPRRRGRRAARPR